MRYNIIIWCFGCSILDIWQVVTLYLHYNYLFGISTISKIVREVCCEIWTELRLECIPVPDKNKYESVG